MQGKLNNSWFEFNQRSSKTNYRNQRPNQKMKGGANLRK